MVQQLHTHENKGVTLVFKVTVVIKSYRAFLMFYHALEKTVKSEFSLKKTRDKTSKFRDNETNCS